MKVRIIIPGRVDTNHPQELGAPLSYGKKNIAAKKLSFAVMNNHHFLWENQLLYYGHFQ